MPLDLELTRIFVKVAQNSSFTRAALQLKLPKSTVSKSITRLESETNTKLIVRTTRSLTLTAAGRAFYEACLGPIQSIEDAQKSLHGQDSILSGRIRLTAPEDLGSNLIAPVIAALAIENPGLSFDLVYTNQIIDLVKDGFDLAIRIGRLNESNFKVKRVGENYLIPVASPSYLSTRQKIRHPKDLEQHDCLTLTFRSFETKWILKSESGTAKVPVRTRVTSNQMTSLLNAAIAGGGVALVPTFLCREAIKDGRLVHILPTWHTAPIPVSIITPLAAATSARLRITVERLVPMLQQALSGN